MKLCTLLDEFIYSYGSRGPQRVGDALADLGDQAQPGARPPSTACGSPPSPPRRSRRTRVWRPTESSSSSSSANPLAGDPATQGQFLAAVRAAQVFLPGRERTKTNNIRMVHEARMTLRELGRRMVERGAFDEIEDFGMLRKAEFDDFLADPHAFTHTIRARRAQYDELSALEPQFVFVGEPDFPDAWTSRAANNVTQARRRATRSRDSPAAPVSQRDERG